jgi:hypothetical protein
MVLLPGAQQSPTWESLTALTQRVHSDGTILPGWKYFLLMDIDGKLGLSNTARCVKAGLCENFAFYRQQIVG